MKYSLTKSSYVKGMQCEKYLYLDKHKRQEKSKVSEETKRKFDAGHEFEEFVRKDLFPNGINIKALSSFFNEFAELTTKSLNLNQEITLYEATIIENGVLVMCDILRKSVNGDIHIYEIKNTKKINEAISSDLSVQFYVCKKRFGENLKSFHLIKLKENEENEIEAINFYDQLNTSETEVIHQISKFNSVLEGKEPTIKPGSHCETPYQCEFMEYCNKKKFIFF
jgi:hypothetical protein